MKNSFKNLLLISSAFSALTAGEAIADSTYNINNHNWYVGLSGDLTWMHHSDVGGGGNLTFGYRMNQIRLEAEAGYHEAGGRGGYGSTSYFNYMANAYYDFNWLLPTSSSGWHITPYVGGGIGDAAVHYGSRGFSTTFRHHDNTFAYQAMAGLTFTSVSQPNLDYSVGYRYLGTDERNVNANSLELGIRLHF